MVSRPLISVAQVIMWFVGVGMVGSQCGDMSPEENSVLCMEYSLSFSFLGGTSLDIEIVAVRPVNVMKHRRSLSASGWACQEAL